MLEPFSCAQDLFGLAGHTNHLKPWANHRGARGTSQPFYLEARTCARKTDATVGICHVDVMLTCFAVLREEQVSASETRLPLE